MIYKNKLITSILYKVNAVTVSPLSIKDGEDGLKVNESTGKAYIRVHQLQELSVITMKTIFVEIAIMIVMHCLVVLIPV